MVVLCSTRSILDHFIFYYPPANSWVSPLPSPWQVKMTNWNPHHNLPKTCRGRKSICPICVSPTDNFQTHPSTSFRINELWSDQCHCTDPLLPFFIRAYHWLMSSMNAQTVCIGTQIIFNSTQGQVSVSINYIPIN